MRNIVWALSMVALAGCFEPPVAPDQPPGWLSVEDNHILLDGEVWAGRGVTVFDSRQCGACAYREPDRGLLDETLRRVDEAVSVWGADYLRLLMQSYGEDPGWEHWQGVLDDPDYLAQLVEIVQHVGTHPGVFVELSLYTDATLDADQRPTDGTAEVWDLLAETFVDQPHVLYGLANEPSSDGDHPVVWEPLDAAAQAIRDVEDRHGTPRHVIVAPGTDRWGTDLAYYLDHPIEAGGGTDIAYDVRIQDGPSVVEWRVFELAESLPLIISYLGPIEDGGLVTITVDECLDVMEQAGVAGIPYAAWSFHWNCGWSNLLEPSTTGTCGVDTELTPSDPWGVAVQQHLTAPR